VDDRALLQAEETPITGSGTVLLVDDEATIRQVGQLMLEHLGYAVITASGGREAVERLRRMEAAPDLVILDIIMPGIGGGETFDLLWAERPGIRVMLSSGYSADGQAREILARGCSGFIQKPFRLLELSRKIHDILDPAGQASAPQGGAATQAGKECH
jgi:CheY-like chemotaxis protein